MTTFLLVRHGQTAWNREERFRGQVDVPLDETGLTQAAAAGRRIAGEWKPAAVYSSPLQRALDTAAPIARACGLHTASHGGLLDINFGACAGLSGAEFEARYPVLAAAWREEPHTVRFPGGEALDDVLLRAEGLVAELTGRHPDQVVVIVTHLVVCRLLLCSLLGLGTRDFWRFEPATASLSVFDLSSGARALRVLNDTCHLRASGIGACAPDIVPL